MVLRQNAEGLIYGITYVDHQTQSVFNGSALGKLYSAKAIQKRCGLNELVHQKTAVYKVKKSDGISLQSDSREVRHTSVGENSKKSITGDDTNVIAKFVNALTQSEYDSSYLPNQLKGKKKKKKRKGQSDNQ